MSTPTINGGYELTIGDHLGIGPAPDCCDNEMTTRPKNTNQQTFICDDCKTVVVVDGNGLIYDIY
ncbi:hypothetical protein J3A78_002375 [Streptomyces sp. PvR006]|uniref:hypothetical protein n=1 Tax=Streptomyces sp. PvR006 TaxID=2817860 RepID=UPI001AE69990|nr:hypothetical protein [Streptomyces sp. PvR006]MBP2581897.1 hypothetical protein [Streptomyces sp. PvR006]